MTDTLVAEQSVIGSMMLIGDMTQASAEKILGYLREGAFQHRVHVLIWRAIRQMANAGDFVDLITLNATLTRSGDIEAVGGISYLAELAKNTPSAANVMAYADIVRQGAVRRSVSSRLQNALAMLNETDGVSVYEKVGLIESELSAISDRASRGRESGLVHVSEIASQWTEDLENRFENPTTSQGFTTGVAGIDRILAPKNLKPGSLVVIGARPKMGKSALMNMIAKHFALEHKLSTAIFSLEMPSDQIFERMISERARIDPGMFYQGADNDTDFAKVSMAMGEYVNSKTYIDDTPGIGITHVQRESRKLGKHEQVGLICVDYLTLMTAGKADRNDLAYGEITKALKNLAKELNCIVLLLTQLNRSLETRANKRPMPSDSRDTGQIEQDCDVWIGLYRESVYKTDVQTPGLTEALIRLNRHGQIGTAYLNLIHGYFEEAPVAQVSLGTSKMEKAIHDF
ncbi:replicative DNA helicase [Enterovibrio norvegicus]|uniref:replicative DNA helicase n=1 Tax=Enterovibrio norvegicus TaxID=188144 RepID=UPI0024B251B2|nr:DnaB-like helicase C-terminal domain-containing protein [Enterovibrio norvegicus]